MAWISCPTVTWDGSKVTTNVRRCPSTLCTPGKALTALTALVRQIVQVTPLVCNVTRCSLERGGSACGADGAVGVTWIGSNVAVATGTAGCNCRSGEQAASIIATLAIRRPVTFPNIILLHTSIKYSLPTSSPKDACSCTHIKQLDRCNGKKNALLNRGVGASMRSSRAITFATKFDSAQPTVHAMVWGSG